MPREDDVRKIVTGGRAKGLSDDQIRALVARYDERQQEQPQERVLLDVNTEGLRQRFAESLPNVGSFLGSFAGRRKGKEVGAVGGAAVGGALGKGAEMLIDEKDQTLSEGLRAMGSEALKQGGSELAGVAGGKGIAAVGMGAYKGGVALLPKTLKQQNPTIAATGFKENIALTRRGADKAQRLTSQSRATADTMIANAERAGAPPVRPMEVLGSGAMKPVVSTLRKRADLGLPDDVPALIERSRGFMATHKGGIPLTKAQGLKREAQDMADTAFRAQEKGAVIKSDETLTNQAVARGLRKAIETRVPGVADVNARTQRLMGVAKGAEHASETGHVLPRVLGGIGAGALAGPAGVLPAIAAAGAGSMFTTPGGLTRAGLGLKGLGRGAEYVPQSYRLAALMAALAEEGQGQ